ncbi:MAG: phosphoenolpyruvate carboxykinase (GTP), partial [Sciscionella sp.]
MTAVSRTVPGLDSAPTAHPELVAWVREVAELTIPDKVVWVDGSDAEWERLTSLLVDAGTMVKLDKKPNSYWAASDPADVARFYA